MTRALNIQKWSVYALCGLLPVWLLDAYILSRYPIQGLTPQQAEYNQYAPILMTSVDTDPRLCAQERNAIMRRLGVGNWKIFGAHGSPKDYSIK